MAGVVLALIALALMACGYISVSSAMLNIETGFMLFLGGVGLSLIALAVSLMGLRRTRRKPGRKFAVIGIVLSLMIIAPMSPHIVAAFSVPPIHDITTDTNNPPQFVDILPLRADAPNSTEYAGETLATMQKAAYPAIVSLVLSIAPSEAFTRAQGIVQARGWTPVAANATEGRIEATAETRMMHFKDDIVIRITPEGEGSKIDMRSVSRFGQSDLGVNARRITEFLKDMGAS